MPDPIHGLGIVGLGKMGADLAKNALGKGFAVAGQMRKSAFPDHYRFWTGTRKR